MISSSLVSKLRKITTPVAEPETERCHFCGSVLPAEHRHLADIAQMKFICTCEMCLIKNADVGSYTPLPQRFLHLENFVMSDQLWSDFLIPVNMAFFIKSTIKQGTIAYYPAPTGATESKLKMHAWNNLVESNAILNELMPDLEALLVNRLQDEGQYYIVPVDSCYQLGRHDKNGLARYFRRK